MRYTLDSIKQAVGLRKKAIKPLEERPMAKEQFKAYGTYFQRMKNIDQRDRK